MGWACLEMAKLITLYSAGEELDRQKTIWKTEKKMKKYSWERCGGIVQALDRDGRVAGYMTRWS